MKILGAASSIWRLCRLWIIYKNNTSPYSDTGGRVAACLGAAVKMLTFLCQMCNKFAL